MSAAVGFTIVQLEYFVVVAEAGSIAAASTELNVSPSALSASVMSLEKALGVQLFVRNPPRRVSLSADGHNFLAEARTLLRHARDVAQSARSGANEVEGRLPMGCFAPLAPVCVPRVMRELAQQKAGVGLDLIEGDVGSLHRLVGDGGCEFAVTYLLRPIADVEFEVVRQMAFHAIVRRGHPLGKRKRVSLADLSEYPWIRFDIAESVQVMELLLLEAGLSVQSMMTSTSVETIRSLVGASDGFALLTVPWGTDVTAANDRVVRLEITGLGHQLQLGIMTAPRRRQTARGELVLDCVRTALASL
ncbi:LysR family transcriptional regulator [Nocardioides hungaricus]